MTAKRLRVLSAAEHELDDAGAWYRQQRAELPEEFIADVQGVFTRIAAMPGSFPRVPTVPDLPSDAPEVRRAMLERFPFHVVFVELPDELVVVAVSHVRRKPGYWLTRLGDV